MYAQSKPRESRAAAVVALAIAVLLAGPAVAGAQEMTDQAIADKIDDELIYDRAVPSDAIDVTVNEGVVTLTGTASNLLAKERAGRLAETVKGVRSVVNRIQVEVTEDVSDDALQRRVEAALLSDPATDSYEISVDTREGVVTLKGTVQSWTEKQLAAKVAKGAKGVRGVNNKIEVKYEVERTDAEIMAEVQKALRWDALVDHALIDVEVNDGVVALSGVVGSASEKRRAEYNAWVTGVESVEAEKLNVERWARDEELRKDKYTVRSAEDIEGALKDALTYDPRVLSFNVTPEVSGSTVTLRGVVDNLKAKRAAEQVAKNTVGVTYVTNRLKVRPVEDLSDQEVAEDVRNALVRDPYVDRYEISVSVADGTAYLSGTVDSYFEKWQADDIVSRVNGVVTVRNNLDVDFLGPLAYDPYVDEEYPYVYEWYDYTPTYTFETDAEVKDHVERELWWSPFVDRDDVNIAVDDGRVTLAGSVESWSEFNAATEEAYEGGATWVDNDLTVE
jgi:osmotically-inducible protein OsmY